MNWRIIFFSISAASAAAFISWVFWEQEIKFALPTPVPASFREVKIGQYIDLASYSINKGKPVMLHFFNPDCPCSRFNMTEFERLSHKYLGKVDVYVVIQARDEKAVTKFKSKYNLGLPVLLDKEGAISQRCGIYSTPQCVLLNKSSTLYFKGNYNIARYCTRKETSFADIASDNLIRGNGLPLWVVTELTLPYGCELPSDKPALSSQSFDLFNF